MSAPFWIGLFWLAYVYLGYPLLLLLLAPLLRVRPRMDDGQLPTVSVLLSAHNEEKDIGWKVEQTLSWDYPRERLQMLVASDSSTDRTDGILAAIGDPRLVFVALRDRGGKNLALNRLMEHATGEVLFFTDANSSIDPGCLRRMVQHFADPRVGCVTGEMHYVRDPEAGAVAAGASVYWGYESVIKRLESSIGSVLVCVGSIFCIRRELFSPLQPDVANDLEMPLRIGHAGHLLRYEPTALSIERATSSPREEYARRRRICGRGIIGMWKLRRTLLGFRGWQFVSRKLLRWLAVIPLAMMLIGSATSFGNPLYTAAFAVQAACYGLALVGGLFALAGKNGVRLFSVPFYFVLVNVAAFAGILNVLRGRRFTTWNTAMKSRGRAER